MPFWLVLALTGMQLFQGIRAQDAQNEALRAMREGGLSPEELADMRRRGEGALRLDMARRGGLDSGLFAGGRAALEGELALAKAKGKMPYQMAYINTLLGQGQQGGGFLESLVPLFMQYGVQRPGGGYFINPYNPTPGVRITGGGPRPGSGGPYYP